MTKQKKPTGTEIAKEARDAKKETARDTKKDVSMKEFDNLLSTLQDKFGEGAIMKLGDVSKVDVAVVPTGSFSLDMALGVGGMPRGRITEILARNQAARPRSL